MGRKRLQHAADILCHKFTGWELQADYESLTSWREGALEIDALSGRCLLDGRKVELLMATALKGWLAGDLEEHRIGLEEVDAARLRVEFVTERYEGQRDRSMSYGDPYPHFIGCEVRCESKVATVDRVYESRLEDTLEWPLPKRFR